MAYRKPGKPAKKEEPWNDTVPERAYELCLIGLRDADLAVAFGVSIYSIDKWKQVHPAFKDALKRGKNEADAKVAEALFHKAVGYSHKAVDIRVIEGDIVKVPYTKTYPPDTTACIFWLKNRQREYWADTKRSELSGKVNVEHTMRKQIDLSDFSSEELALANKLASRMLQEGAEDAEFIEEGVDSGEE